MATHDDPVNSNGVKTVSIGGRTVTYRNTKELLEEIRATERRDGKRRNFTIGVPKVRYE